jgi:CHASE2 domain-containing sensor protein
MTEVEGGTTEPPSGDAAPTAAPPPQTADPSSDTDASTAPHPRHRRKPHGPITLAGLLAERRRAGISFAVGLIVLLLIQIPSVEQSFLGAPDRQMLETAFKLRSDAVAGTASPVLFLDFDDHTIGAGGAYFAPPPPTTPRVLIAQLLDFIRTSPANSAPRVALLDIDIGQTAPPGDIGVVALNDELAKWASTPTAPPLIIAREAFPAEIIGAPRPGLALPVTPYDTVVNRAPNIYWSTVQVLGDQAGVIREFLPFECVQTAGGGWEPLYSAVLLAYQFSERDTGVLGRAPARHWMADALGHCQTRPATPLTRGERIDFHFSLGYGFQNRVWPSLSPAWQGARQCHDTDTAIFRRISAGDVLDALAANADVSRALLCQHVVIIGGTNRGANDFVQTPLDEMNGSVVLANSIRGLELTHGGMRAIPLVFQIAGLLLVSLAMTVSAAATEHARHRLRQLRRGPHSGHLSGRAGMVLLNPVILNGGIAVAAHCAGIVLLFVLLNFGLWGFLSAPAFAVAITETIQEFFDV